MLRLQRIKRFAYEVMKMRTMTTPHTAHRHGNQPHLMWKQQLA